MIEKEGSTTTLNSESLNNKYFEPITIGAKEIWPRINERVQQLIMITRPLMTSCVNSLLKWASSIHAELRRTV